MLEEMRNPKPLVVEELCDGCGRCVDECFDGHGALAMKDSSFVVPTTEKDNKAVVVAPERCESEGACLQVCERGALRLE